MVSALFYQVRSRESARRLGQRLSASYDAKPIERTGVVLDPDHVSVGGQRYELANDGGLGLTSGDSLAVVNVQRLASAYYAPATGAGALLFSTRGATGNALTTSSASVAAIGSATNDLSKSAVGKLSLVTIGTADSPYTAAADYRVIVCNTTEGNITVNLPAGTTSYGWSYNIKNIATGTVSVIGAGSDTIDGAGTMQLARQYDGMAIVCNGSAQWWII